MARTKNRMLLTCSAALLLAAIAPAQMIDNTLAPNKRMRVFTSRCRMRLAPVAAMG